MVAGCDLNASNGEEDYPNPAGFTNLVEAADAVAELERQHEDAAVEKIACAHPAEEFDEVARTVAEAVHDGTDPGAITVACPHRLWMEGIAAALRNATFPASSTRGPAKPRAIRARKPVAGMCARAPRPSSSPTSAISPPGAAGWA